MNICIRYIRVYIYTYMNMCIYMYVSIYMWYDLANSFAATGAVERLAACVCACV